MLPNEEPYLLLKTKGKLFFQRHDLLISTVSFTIQVQIGLQSAPEGNENRSGALGHPLRSGIQNRTYE